MRRFVVTIILSLGIPVLLLVVLFCVTDPYRTIHKFDPTNAYDDAREYVSTELFLRNNPTQHYNAFVFANSRAAAITTYLWRSLIGDDARPFLFQAWAEDVEGIQQKVDFVDRTGNDLDYALVLVDQSTFPTKINRKGLLHLRHPLLSGQSWIGFQADVFKNYIQKPSQWTQSFKSFIRGEKLSLSCDTVTNDVYDYYADVWDDDLQPDSLNACSPIVREAFIEEARHLDDRNIRTSRPLITAQYEAYLRHIKSVFDAHHTQYKILIMPAYIYKNKLFNPQDLDLLNDIFGSENVYNYMQKSVLTTDYNYYFDPAHPGLLAGSIILREIYSSQASTDSTITK